MDLLPAFPQLFFHPKPEIAKHMPYRDMITDAGQKRFTKYIPPAFFLDIGTLFCTTELSLSFPERIKKDTVKKDHHDRLVQDMEQSEN